MEKRGHTALLPFPFLIGALTVLVVWGIGVWVWERLSNFMVVSGLLVSSRKPHVFDLPMTGVGMDWRTIGALVGLMFVVGGVFTIFGHVGHTDRNVVDEIARPSRPAGESIPRGDSFDMGMPMGGDPFGPPMGMGGMGGDPFGPPMGGPGGMPPMGPPGF